MSPNTPFIMSHIHHSKFEVATPNCLGNAFTRKYIKCCRVHSTSCDLCICVRFEVTSSNGLGEYVHYQMQPTELKPRTSNVNTASKLIWYRFIGNRVRVIFLVHTKMFTHAFNYKSVHEFRSHNIHAISL